MRDCVYREHAPGGGGTLRVRVQRVERRHRDFRCPTIVSMPVRPPYHPKAEKGTCKGVPPQIFALRARPRRRLPRAHADADGGAAALLDSGALAEDFAVAGVKTMSFWSFDPAGQPQDPLQRRNGP